MHVCVTAIVLPFVLVGDGYDIAPPVRFVPLWTVFLIGVSLYAKRNIFGHHRRLVFTHVVTLCWVRLIRWRDGLTACECDPRRACVLVGYGTQLFLAAYSCTVDPLYRDVSSRTQFSTLFALLVRSTVVHSTVLCVVGSSRVCARVRGRRHPGHSS